MSMFHDQGISTHRRSRSLRELNTLKSDDDTLSTPKAPYRQRHEVNDLKTSLNRAMFERESLNNGFLRRPVRTSRYDPRRNTTGLTEFEIRQNQTSKF